MTKRIIHTEYTRPPIPNRNWDWIATYDDYDGAPDAPHQTIGHGPTEQAAIDDLQEQEAA